MCNSLLDNSFLLLLLTAWSHPTSSIVAILKHFSMSSCLLLPPPLLTSPLSSISSVFLNCDWVWIECKFGKKFSWAWFKGWFSSRACSTGWSIEGQWLMLHGDQKENKLISPAKELFAVVCVFSKLIEGRTCSIWWFPQGTTSYCFQTAQEFQDDGSQWACLHKLRYQRSPLSLLQSLLTWVQEMW